MSLEDSSHTFCSRTPILGRNDLARNQLAVFLESAGLTSGELLAITRAMGFSETTFVFPAESPETDSRVRIFGLNLNREIEVAGHPTIGTVFALANRDGSRPAVRRSSLHWASDPRR